MKTIILFILLFLTSCASTHCGMFRRDAIKNPVSTALCLWEWPFLFVEAVVCSDNPNYLKN